MPRPRGPRIETLMKAAAAAGMRLTMVIAPDGTKRIDATPANDNHDNQQQQPGQQGDTGWQNADPI